MNTDQANTEPFYRFHRFHEELSLNMRITVAGLAELKRRVAENKRAGQLTQLPTDGEPWSLNSWKDPGRGIPRATRFVAQMGVVRVVTALEDFCIGVKAECDRYASLRGLSVKGGGESESDDLGISPKRLYEATRWHKDVLLRIDPLYEYFSKVRNCVVHRSGRASRELNRVAASSSLQQCMDTWHEASPDKKLPALPSITINDELPLLPRHAILANEVCRRIAVDANKKLVEFLGIEGIVYMAAYYSLFADRPIRTDARKSPKAMLNTILSNRYRVVLDYSEEAVMALGRLQQWKPYLRKFDKLSAKS